MDVGARNSSHPDSQQGRVLTSVEAAQNDLEEGAPVLDARGFALPRGSPASCTEYLWAVSAFHFREGAHIHVAATCFDTTLWAADLPLRDVASNLQADLGLVLPQGQLLQLLQEALTAAQAPPPVPPAEQQQYRQQQQQAQPSSSAPAPVTTAAKAAVELHVPHGNGSLEAAGGVVGCPPPASMTVMLPPCRFGGREVTVRLPVHGNMRRIEGPEAQRQCLSLVSCLHRQLEDMRGELRGARTELRQLRDERVLLLKELELSAAGGEAAGAQTLRSQYGLAGAPPPLPAAAAKRQRTAPAASLGHLLGDSGLGGGLASRSGSGLMAGLALQSQQAQQPLPLASQASGGLFAGAAAPPAAGAGGAAAAAQTASRVNWGLWSEPQSQSQGGSQAQQQAQPPAAAKLQGAPQPAAASGAAAGAADASAAGAAGESPAALALEGAGAGAGDGPSAAAVTIGQEGGGSADPAPGQASAQHQELAAVAAQARDPSRVAVSIRLGGGPPGRGRGGARGAWPRR
ncbi:hypothetical protein CHLRE_10g438000v5 [Chlamydomonas reinhardtii]|uniref:Uncharacterized protein n=1 Tax=Chlamydomonas reinhardtii TaxID=3055 RepID=A8IG54_CHLRE|nr:uncharacterized protein CHLRE_10g438000v5 [Chlamydomonas reinhardtii]PNW77471.1 hypothetical protein CHLRE_10g438000v5 [Chlamydomonas reinhardtii]|eukprot:XP_001690571.1 predicted protein [Chlamydomonas reinhardtii]